MCLSIATRFPERVLATGEHDGHEWVVVHNGAGSRCGYVKVEPGHPWHGADYDEIDAEVHGGLTFAQPDTPCGKGGADSGWWFGFDCAHAWDSPDPSLPNCRDFGLDWGVVRTQEYAEAECCSLCEQAAVAAAKVDTNEKGN